MTDREFINLQCGDVISTVHNDFWYVVLDATYTNCILVKLMYCENQEQYEIGTDWFVFTIDRHRFVKHESAWNINFV